MGLLQGPRLMAWTTKSPILENHWVPWGCMAHFGSVKTFDLYTENEKIQIYFSFFYRINNVCKYSSKVILIFWEWRQRLKIFLDYKVIFQKKNSEITTRCCLSGLISSWWVSRGPHGNCHKRAKKCNLRKKKHFKVLFWSNFNKIKYFTYLRKHLYILQQWEAKSKCLSYPIFPLLFIDANWSIQMYRKYNVTTIVFPNLMILCWLKRHISKHPLYPFDWQYSFTSIFIKKGVSTCISFV